MVTFQVSDMIFGHSAGAISRSIASVDKSARTGVLIEYKVMQFLSTLAAIELDGAISRRLHAASRRRR